MTRITGARLALCAAAWIASIASSYGQTPPSAVSSKPNAQSIYAAQCSACHGANLQGGQFAPALKGAGFTLRWNGQNAELLNFVTTKMPPSSVGALSAADYAAVVDLIVQANGGLGGGAEGKTEAANPDRNARSWAGLGPQPPAQSAFHDAIYAREMQRRGALLSAISPVTAGMLRSPPADDWLAWRRTEDATGYSPLKQIDQATVAHLQLKWAWSLTPGKNETAPLVHDGVMFVNSANTVEALDASNGTLLWRYVREIPPEYSGATNLTQRSIAIYGRLLYVPTADRHLVALDVASGKVVWDSEIVSPAKAGAVLSGGPLVAHDVVVQGISMSVGCPGGCGVVGLDPQSGKILWRFNTVAQPGHPGADSWNGTPPDTRMGASVWTAPSYDPDLDLVFVGTGNTYDITRLLKPDPPAPGQSNEALYTDSTLALRPQTGELVWYHQHFPREVWDLDEAFERTLITLPIGGQPHRLAVTIGKAGILDALDRADGRYAFSIDLGLNNIVTSIDPKTGQRSVDPAKIPKANQPVEICPSPQGVRNWMATAYDPASRVLYVPIQEACMDFTWVDTPDTADGPISMGWTVKPRPGSDGMRGRLEAIDLVHRKPVWIAHERTPPMSSLLVTAGGVLFSGSGDRAFEARDVRTGKVLWQTRLSAPPNSTPITFSIHGKQYVAVVSGAGGAHESQSEPLNPELDSSSPATTIWVFGL